MAARPIPSPAKRFPSRSYSFRSPSFQAPPVDPDDRREFRALRGKEEVEPVLEGIRVGTLDVGDVLHLPRAGPLEEGDEGDYGCSCHSLFITPPRPDREWNL